MDAPKMTCLVQEKLTPRAIVAALDLHIVGQQDAKRAVANAYRYRLRRLRVSEDLRKEISPKNILMVGSTGVGKTEIARRLARLVSAPFIKVEATKFTEVGYVGKDVDSIIRDLVEDALIKVRTQAYEEVEYQANMHALNRVCMALKQRELSEQDDEALMRALEAGEYDELEVDIEVQAGAVGYEIVMPQGMEELSQHLQQLMQAVHSDRVVQRRMTVKKAIALLRDEESAKLLNEDELRQRAIQLTEEEGIVFIDEIDKVVRSDQYHGDVSREGVQRDLLPLLDGTVVNTKYGNVSTDHILFIASGAFMNSHPRDMLSELQGRLPISVTLHPLTQQDFERILKEPQNSLVKQYQALLATEGVEVVFHDDALVRIAELAAHLNSVQENIGARRLQALMEMLLDQLSFEAEQHEGQLVTIDRAYVDAHTSCDPVRDERHWIL